MRQAIVSSICAVAMSICSCALGGQAPSVPEGRGVAMLTDRALKGDHNAMATLREEGPAGLRQLLEACAPELAKHSARSKPLAVTPPKSSSGDNMTGWERMETAIDTVAAQRDAWASKLYWYTDFTQAKSAAAREHKPILSLRLLGRLDQELSCANSRFFRTTLYPDPAVSQLLRDRFILFWSSERPVPVVTIDFGNGRTMKRTLGGNSIHYVLDEQGRPIDALPGLYSADEFVRQLKNDLDLHDKLAGLSGPAWQGVLSDYHMNSVRELDRRWKEQLRKAHLDTRLSPDQANDHIWDQLAALQPLVQLSAPVLAVVSAKAPPPIQAAERLTATKARVENPIVLAIAGLQESIAQDTFRDEYKLHWQIHLWFYEPGSTVAENVDTLNQVAYSRLFLTPRSDPWLGMAGTDVYSALDNGGLPVNAKR